MTKPKLPECYSYTRVSAQEVMLPRYEGTTEIYEVQGSRCESVTCGHQHRTYEAAQQCVEAKARTLVRLRTAVRQAANLRLPCRYVAKREQFSGPEQWQKRCASHNTGAYSPHPLAGSEQDALAQDWTCPWAPFVQAPCRRTSAHTPHDGCPGTAPEYPSEPVELVGAYADHDPAGCGCGYHTSQRDDSAPEHTPAPEIGSERTWRGERIGGDGTVSSTDYPLSAYCAGCDEELTQDFIGEPWRHTSA